jgi:hypothetical protein
MEARYFNPHKVDIFKEQETDYYACLFKKQATKSERGDNKEMLNEMHEKALKTMQVLCDHLNADSRDLYAEHLC